jgi:hypothetical protein
VPNSQQPVATPKVLPMPISSWLDRDESAPRLIPCFELEGVIFVECLVFVEASLWLQHSSNLTKFKFSTRAKYFGTRSTWCTRSTQWL